MKILSHRGFWSEKIAPNSRQAFLNSFENGFGVEFDIRDLDGEIVVSHDMPCLKDDIMTFNEFLSLYQTHGDNLKLAVNVKADGMQNSVINLLKKYNVTNYFLFDMSVPDAIAYYKKGLKNIFTRQSDYEDLPSFYSIASGVWMDEFEKEWISKDLIYKNLDSQRDVVIVSPELHKKDNYLARWNFYKTLNHEKLFLCTDFPQLALSFFK